MTTDRKPDSQSVPKCPPIHQVYRAALDANADVNALEAEDAALRAEHDRATVEFSQNLKQNREARDAAYDVRTKANAALLNALKGYRPSTEAGEP